MQKFRLKNLQLLIATDVAARGLDVDDLTHIIHYGLPDETESYTHRSGRTGRVGKTGISIAICHSREKHKIREISKFINKTFEKGVFPSGHAICEKQLFSFIDRLEKVKVNEDEIAVLMPSVFRKLDWLEKEDIIKRLISLEFNRMLDYYRDADEIVTVDESSGKERKTGKSGKQGKRMVNGQWSMVNGQSGKQGTHQAEKGYERLFLNFGKADGISPGQLIELINRCVPGKVQIGRIDLRDAFSFFEVEAKDVRRVMERMNSYEVDGRVISVEPAQDNRNGDKKREPAPRKSKYKNNNSDKPWRQNSFDRFRQKKRK
jgi:ATP-dependent RNA helicase DeaD